MKDEETFKKFVNHKSSKTYLNEHLSTVLSTLSIMLENEKYAFDAFKMLIDLYFMVEDDNYLFDEVLKYLKPISTNVGLIAMPLSKKIECFFKMIDGKDDEKSYKLIKKLYDSTTESIMICESKKRPYKRKNYPVYLQEVIEMKNKVFEWLYNHDNDSDAKITTLKSLLNNMNFCDQSTFVNQFMLLESSFLSEQDDVKIIAIQEVLETRENILQFPNWGKMNKYVNMFDSFVNNLQPSDVYMRNKLVLLKDNYPVLNPPCIDDDDWYIKKDKLREERQKEAFECVCAVYGNDVLDRLISDSFEDSYSIFELIFNKSTDHKHDLEMMISNKKNCGVKAYLSMANDEDIADLIGNYLEEDIVLGNLPYKKVVFDLISGNIKENVYWDNQRFHLVENVQFDFLFDKFLQFSPSNMISYFAYKSDMNYDYLIRLVKKIVDLYVMDNKDKKILNEVYEIQELISKMDSLFFTEELSQCEYKLLPILKGNIGDYPMGVKRYFWNNPEKFSSLMAELFNKKETLEFGGLEHEILFDALYSINSKCFIPSEYITLKNNELLNWSKKYIESYDNQSEDTIDFLNKVLAHVLACCPKEKTMDLWPIKEVADIIENISETYYDDSKEIARAFAIAYLNGLGVRTIENGTREQEIALEFSRFSDSYRMTHPTICEALDIISADYYATAEYDQKIATDGNE